jgi:hypothetical protein
MEDNIKTIGHMYIECKGVDWAKVALDRFQWRAFLNGKTNLSGVKNGELQTTLSTRQVILNMQLKMVQTTREKQ